MQFCFKSKFQQTYKFVKLNEKDSKATIKSNFSDKLLKMLFKWHPTQIIL